MADQTEKFIELRNGLSVPIIGLGTSLRGKPKIDNQTFINSVKHAIQTGYRHIDTVQKFRYYQLNLDLGIIIYSFRPSVIITRT